MLTSNILDIAITLGFTYTMLALIVSTITEIFNTVMQRRSIYLQRGLKALFDNISMKNPGFRPKEFFKNLKGENSKAKDDGKAKENNEPAVSTGEKTIFQLVIDSPFIKVLRTEPGVTVKLLSKLKLFKEEDAWFPSYITPNTLAMAVMDVLDIKSVTDPTKENVKEKINENSKLSENPEVQNLLLTLLDNSEDKDGNFTLKSFTDSIEKTFNDCMDRITGLYKRKSQWISFILSVVVVLIINVDSLKVAKSLHADRELLQNAVNIATNSYQQFNPENYISKSNTDTSNRGDNTTDTTEVTEQDETSLEVTAGESKDTVVSIQKRKNDIDVFISKINELKIPIGWGEKTIPGLDEFGKAIPGSLLGWLVSILAIYLGAPFWFDVLNKFTNIRGAGSRPPTTPGSDASKEEGKK